MLKLLPTTLVLAASLAGCVTEGRDFHSETAWIKNGQTKQSDVKMMLGDPEKVGNFGGKPTWTYGFYRYKLIGKSLQKELKFFWQNDGTLETFSFTSSFPEDIGNTGPGAGQAPANKADF